MKNLPRIYTGLTLALTMILTAFLVTCKQDPAERPFPRTLTTGVTDISVNRAIFHGDILALGHEPVTDYGFVCMSDPSLLDLDRGIVFSLGSINHTGPFFYEGLIKQPRPMQLYVRTYLTTKTYTVYGNTVSFYYPGGQAPVIDSVTPLTASWLDTLSLWGGVFDGAGKFNTVTLGSQEAQLVSQSDSLLRFVVPVDLNEEHTPVILKVYGNTTQYKEDFSLIPPQLTRFAPDSGYYGQEIRFVGKHFHPWKSHNKVSVDGYSCSVNEASPEEITVTLPSGLGEGWHPVRLITQQFTLNASDSFYCSAPVIEKIAPLKGTFLDTLTLTGKNLHGEISDKRMLIGDKEAHILSASDTLIRFIVPEALNQHTAGFTYILNSVRFPVNNYVFELSPPEIYSVLPDDTCDINDRIVINGRYFHGEYTQISIQDVTGAALSGSGHTTLHALVPYNISVPDGRASLTVTSVPNLSVTWEKKLIIYPPKLSGFTADSFTVDETVTVRTEHMNDYYPDTYNKLYQDDQLRDFVYHPSDKTLTFRIPENTPMESEIYDITNGQKSNTLSLLLKKIAVTDVSPNIIYRGAVVTVTGRNFCHTSGGDHINKIYPTIMDGEPATITSYSATQLTFTIPNRFFNPGPVELQVKVGVQLITLENCMTFVESWEQGNTLDLDPTDDLTSAIIADDVYIGAPPGKKSYWKYNIPGKTLIRLPDLPAECAGPSSFALGGKIYLFGFNPDSMNYSSTEGAFSYDPASGEWIDLTLPDNISVHPFMTAFTIAGKAYIGLGSLGDDSYSDWYEYDGATDTWTRKASFPGTLPHAFSPTSFVIDDKGYVITNAGELWQYDPATDQWSQRANTPFSSRTGMIAFTLEGKGYAGLGEDNSAVIYDDFWEYDPAADSWTKMIEAPLPLSSAFSFSYDGKGYVGGGLSTSRTSNKSLWLFTPLQ
jgi:N-acetylneuraminic acid mutarotase